MSSTTAVSIIDVLREWFATHGLLDEVITDDGPQFIAESYLWNEMGSNT